MPLQRIFRGLGVERLAVVEFHPWPQFYRHLLAVGGGLVGQRELRHDIELFVDVEQLVTKRCEYDAAGIGAAERGVEHVGIFGETDAKRRLGESARTERDEKRHCGGCNTKSSHRSGPSVQAPS